MPCDNESATNQELINAHPSEENEQDTTGDKQTQLANQEVADATIGNTIFGGLSQLGIIFISIVAGLGILVFLGCLLFCFKKKKRSQSEKSGKDKVEMRRVTKAKMASIDYDQQMPTPYMSHHLQKDADATTHSIFGNDTTMYASSQSRTKANFHHKLGSFH